MADTTFNKKELAETTRSQAFAELTRAGSWVPFTDLLRASTATTDPMLKKWYATNSWQGDGVDPSLVPTLKKYYTEPLITALESLGSLIESRSEGGKREYRIRTTAISSDRESMDVAGDHVVPPAEPATALGRKHSGSPAPTKNGNGPASETAAALEPELTVHPIAEIFPLIEGDAYEKLKTDIKQHGQREPIITYQGQILDGRNRYHACRDLGIKPRTEEWHGGGSLLDFVVSRNLHRRHLSPSQQAMIGVRLVKEYEAEASCQKSAAHDNPRANLPTGRLRDKVAKQVGTSSRNIASGLQVENKGVPELVAAVNRNEIKVSPAALLASQPKEEQTAILAQGPKAIKEKVAELQKKGKKKKSEQPSLIASVPEAEPLATSPPSVKDVLPQLAELLTEAEDLAAIAFPGGERKKIAALKRKLGRVSLQNLAFVLTALSEKPTHMGDVDNECALT